ncbi:MAG: BatA domain-containing protein [Candidatus Binatia bacterium]
MDFSFLTPWAFRLLYALPLLLVPYLFRERGNRVVVPALFLYQGLPAAARRRLWGRLRLTPLFFFQLLLLLLLIAAAAQPFLHQRGEKVAIVLDTSASMQARIDAGGPSVFDQAKQYALDTLAAVSSEDAVSFFVTTPFPTLVSAADTRKQLQEAVQKATATDMPDASDDVLGAFVSQLLNEQEFQRVVLVTDRPLAKESQITGVTVHTFDTTQPNLAITAFHVYRSPFAPNDVDATVVVDGREPGLNGSVGIEDAETGQLLVSQPLLKSEHATIAFPRLPLKTTYRARLFVDDGLAIDNEAYAVLPSLSTIPLLLVSPSTKVAQSLQQIPNLQVERVSPQDYIPARVADAPLVLFHLVVPEALPPTNAAFIFPPEGNALFPLGKAAARPQVTKWSSANPVTSYVSFPLLTPTYAQALLPVGWCTSVIDSTIGTLVLAGERDGHRYVAIGFDLLPYLGKQNLPMSILTLNILGWLADQVGQPPDLQTGMALPVTGVETRVRQPNGEAVSVSGNSVVLAQQGIYTITQGGQGGQQTGERRIAVNLRDAQESQLGRPLQLGQVAGTTPKTPERTGQPLWPWLLLAVVFLLVIDWWWAMRGSIKKTVSVASL